MKTVYIPKGETVRYESLVTDRLVVKGCLKTAYGVKAGTISGDGVICAGSVEADVIRTGSIEAAAVICKRLIAKRVQAPEVFASESAAVSCFLSAAYVETGKLTVAVSDIDQVKAGEVVNLPQKKRTLFGTLLSSSLRSFWTALTAPKTNGDAADAEDAAAQPEQPAEPEPSAEAASAPAREAEGPLSEQPFQNAQAEPVDEELNRFTGLFKLLRENGYTLKVVPGTPEENAPVFDFDAEKIVRPAA